MKVRLAAPAQEQADRIDRWWKDNRPAAPDLFARELAQAYSLLESVPDMGSPYVERHGAIVRRVLLPKTRNHVYYVIDRAQFESRNPLLGADSVDVVVMRGNESAKGDGNEILIRLLWFTVRYG